MTCGYRSRVTEDDRIGSLVDTLAATLAEIEASDLDRPEGVDRFLWSADLLDGMARSVDTIARIVNIHAASDASAVRERADILSQTIISQRNQLISHGRGARPSRVPTSWPAPERSPATEAAPRPKPTMPPAQRLMEQEWTNRPTRRP